MASLGVKEMAARGRGGARGEDARQRILAAAETVFLRDGYIAGSTNEIAALAGASKATVFRHFPTKAVLFAAVISRSATGAAIDLEAATAGIDDPEGYLVAVGELHLGWMMTPRMIQMMRVMATEAGRFPELVQAFRRGGAAIFSTAIATHLIRWHKEGVLDCPDPVRHVPNFFDFLVAGPMFRAMTGWQVLDKAGVAAQSRDAARLFLHLLDMRAAEAARSDERPASPMAARPGP